MDSTNVYWNSYLPIFFDRMNACMRKHMTDVVAEKGLTSAHAIYLIALNLNGPMTQKEMSVFLDLDASNTSRVIKILQEKELVTESVNDNGKAIKFVLTTAGRRLANEVMDSTDDWMNEKMQKVPFDSIMEMRNSLITILRDMDPELDYYMNCSYSNRFYTYLGTNLNDDGRKYHGSRRAGVEDAYEVKDRKNE